VQWGRAIWHTRVKISRGGSDRTSADAISCETPSRDRGGLAIGVTEFVLVSHWHLDAPIRRVWDALHEPTGWPRWWPFVAAVEKLQGGDAEGVGARYRFHWTSRLPYSIRLVTQVIEVTRPKRIRASAAGDLQGEGTWRLAERDGGTDVEYIWRVNLDRAWMRLFAPLMRPVFAWNHNAVMAAGEEGLRQFLRDNGAARPRSSVG